MLAVPCHYTDGNLQPSKSSANSSHQASLRRLWASLDSAARTANVLHLRFMHSIVFMSQGLKVLSACAIKQAVSAADI